MLSAKFPAYVNSLLSDVSIVGGEEPVCSRMTIVICHRQAHCRQTTNVEDAEMFAKNKLSSRFWWKPTAVLAQR